jgi:hypothetical protein
MKKIIGLSLVYLFSGIVMANTCPQPNQVYIKSGSRYIIQPPPGWQLNTANGPNYIDSSNIHFEVGAWGADMHTPTDADNHVRCYYYEYENVNHGVSIETVNVIQKNQITPYVEWHFSDATYSLCEDSGTMCRFNG